jgi:hypothetical protein
MRSKVTGVPEQPATGPGPTVKSVHDRAQPTSQVSWAAAPPMGIQYPTAET